MSKDAETVDWECQGQGGYNPRASYIPDGIMLGLHHKTIEDDNAATIIDFKNAVALAHFILNTAKIHDVNYKTHAKPFRDGRAKHLRKVK